MQDKIRLLYYSFQKFCFRLKNSLDNISIFLISDGEVGPQADHTLQSTAGHYLLYNGNIPNAGNPIKFTSDNIGQPFNSSTPTCFSLWYYVNSESKFNLTFGLYTTFNKQTLVPFYKTTGAVLSRTWKKVQGTIFNVIGSSISIQLQHSIPFIGGVAVDDIKLTIGQCKFDAGIDCDFSNGYCGIQV